MLLSQEELARSATMNEEIAKYLEANPRPTLDWTDFDTIRKLMVMMDKAGNDALGRSPDNTEELYHDVPMRDGFMSAIKIHKPKKLSPGPLIVYSFGGGFVGGTNDQFTGIARCLVALFGATVVNISYRLAPEHKFPASQLDAMDSVNWIADNATGPVIASDPTKGFILAGTSAGGAITASLTRYYQAHPLPHRITGQWLGVPSVMDVDCVPERFKSHYVAARQNANAPGLDEQARVNLQKFCAWDPKDPLRYAVHATTPLSGQPRTLFLTDGMDPLRDDALVYDEMLKEAGVETKVYLYEGCPHGHWMGFLGLEISKQTNVDSLVGFGWLLGRETSKQEAIEALGY